MNVFYDSVPLSLIVIFICILSSAFFSASETAITSIGRLKVQQILDSGKKGTRHLKFWVEKSNKILITILIFNNAINIFTSAFATTLATFYFKSNAIGIATGAVTFMVLIFGEIIPKSFAKANAEMLGIFSLRIIIVLYKLFAWLVIPLDFLAKLVINWLGAPKTDSPPVTEEDLEFYLKMSEDTGGIEDIKKDMISNVIDFDETKVREIMTPRTDISAISIESDFLELVHMINETGHSRIPIYEENIDNITGIILAKDALRALTRKDKEPQIKTLIREPFFSPESKPIMDVFKELKRTKNHLTVVIDEYGGTAGLVTMEDILEEIVGEIQDEHDVEEAEILEIETNVFDVAGSVNFDDFVEHFELTEVADTEEETLRPLTSESDTVGGWLTTLIGKIPEIGQKVSFAELNIEITEVGQRRIERLRINRAALKASPDS